jgi:hypothetical protein
MTSVAAAADYRSPRLNPEAEWMKNRRSGASALEIIGDVGKPIRLSE